MNSFSKCYKAAVILFLIASAGCSWSKDGFYIKNQYAEKPALSATSPVVFTEIKEFPSCKVTKLADVKVSRRQYGGEEKVKTTLTEHARLMGGNVILGYNFWIAPSGFVWAAPHGEGTIAQGDLACMKIR